MESDLENLLGELSRGEFEEQVQERYKALIDKEQYAKFGGLIEFTGITPHHETVQAGIEQCFRNSYKKGTLGSFLFLAKTEGYTPSEETVHRAYNEFMPGNIGSIMKSTGVRPTEEFVQEKYAEALGYGRFPLINQIEKYTGIKPKFSEKVIQEKYEHLIRTGRIGELIIVMEITGTIPSEDLVQQGYIKYVEQENFDSVVELKAATGIKPSKDVYKAMIQEKVQV